jgi:signal-transduction protein with cAMP-binding, CBS, and nucleotidyltransferase domain
MPIEKNLTIIEKVIFLKSVDIFEHATIEQLGRIAELTEEVHFEPGTIIFKEGEPGDAFYLLLSGRVLVEKNGNILRELKEKESFGTLEILDFHPRAITAKALDSIARKGDMLTEQQIKRGVHRSSHALEKAIKHYIMLTNENPKPLVWTKTVDEILASVARFCQRISGTGH